jgi:hypothetical protein
MKPKTLKGFAEQGILPGLRITNDGVKASHRVKKSLNWPVDILPCHCQTTHRDLK